jgi:hypothetical protein
MPLISSLSFNTYSHIMFRLEDWQAFPRKYVVVVAIF